MSVAMPLDFTVQKQRDSSGSGIEDRGKTPQSRFGLLQLLSDPPASSSAFRLVTPKGRTQGNCRAVKNFHFFFIITYYLLDFLKMILPSVVVLTIRMNGTKQIKSGWLKVEKCFLLWTFLG